VKSLHEHPVLAATVLAAVLQALWLAFLAGTGGDIAAQDAWAEFAREHPGRAYRFDWFGGLHPFSYSVLSPYVMAALGVRTTMVLAATAASALVALLLVRLPAVRRPLGPALLGAVALFGNSVSGRTTFVLGMVFAVAALLVVLTWPAPGSRRTPRLAAAAVCALLATAGSPVDGLFLGLVAAGLWLRGQRVEAYALGVPPVLLVLFSAVFFPMDGTQPMPWDSMILPVAMAALTWLVVPADWAAVRTVAVIYLVAVVLVWAVPTPIGTNITRLALIFAPVVLAAALGSGARATGWPSVSRTGFARAASRRAPRCRLGSRGPAPVAVFALLAALAWQAGLAGKDLVRTRPDHSWQVDAATVVAKLRDLGAGDTRIEVVPTASHREVSALPFVLARGWTRQVDHELNARFYDLERPLTHAEYRRWLRAWAVGFVVVTPGRRDAGSYTERYLLADRPAYLRPAWSEDDWRIYQVRDPAPTVSRGGRVEEWDQAGMTVWVPRPGRYVIKQQHSDRMVLLDAAGEPIEAPATMAGNATGCVAPTRERPDPEQPDDAETDIEPNVTPPWTVLVAPDRGTYRLSSDYTDDTVCPDP